MDTVTLVRSAIRGVLWSVSRVTGTPRCAWSCAATTSTAPAGKPAIDWDDAPTARDRYSSTPSPATARDSSAALENYSRSAWISRRPPGCSPRSSARISRTRPRRPRDPDREAGGAPIASSGRWTGGAAWAQDGDAQLDGYKGHVAADPDAELVTATGHPGNSGDARRWRPAGRPAGAGGDEPGPLAKSGSERSSPPRTH